MGWSARNEGRISTAVFDGGYHAMHMSNMTTFAKTSICAVHLDSTEEDDALLLNIPAAIGDESISWWSPSVSGDRNQHSWTLNQGFVLVFQFLGLWNMGKWKGFWRCWMVDDWRVLDGFGSWVLDVAWWFGHSLGWVKLPIKLPYVWGNKHLEVLAIT